MKNTLWKGFSTTIVLGLVLLMVSCNKKPENVGLDLLEGEKLIIGSDTTDFIKAYSIYEDSVITSLSTKPYSLLGSFYDPVFGITTASIYSQLRVLESSPDTIGPDVQVDSVVLSMVYSGYYGNIDAYQTIRVYRIAEDLEYDSIYYSNQSVAVDYSDWGELGSLTYLPQPNDSVLLPDDTLYQAAALRVPLDISFGEKILALEDSALVDNERFLDEFKGIYITADPARYPNDGAIIYFSLASSRSLISIYYNDTSELNLYINNLSKRFDHYEHDYTLSTNDEFIQQVVNQDTTLGANHLFLQGLGGIQAKVFFPGLTEWVNGRSIAVHDARLIFTFNQDVYNYDPPVQLRLFEYMEDGTIYSLRDESTTNDFGGEYNEDHQEYAFRIPFYIQELINGEDEYGLNLSVAGKTYNANGVVLQGTNSNNDNAVRLEIIYSEL